MRPDHLDELQRFALKAQLARTKKEARECAFWCAVALGQAKEAASDSGPLGPLMSALKAAISADSLDAIKGNLGVIRGRIQALRADGGNHE